MFIPAGVVLVRRERAQPLDHRRPRQPEPSAADAAASVFSTL
jgi:hypothetical protein